MAEMNSAVATLMNSTHIFHRGDDTFLVRKPLAVTHPATAKEVGTTWVTTYNGKLWPVVICGEDGLQPGFINQRRGPHEVPVIVLGRHMYVFAAAHNLREFDPNHDYLSGLAKFEEPDIVSTDDEPTKVEKQRRRAFEQDAMEFKGAAYWHNFIKQKSKARKLEAQMTAAHIRKQSQTTPKRRRSDDDNHSSASHKRSGTGEKMHWKEVKGLVTPNTSSKKRKLDASAPECAHLFCRSQDEEMDEDYGSSGGRTSSKLLTPRRNDDVFAVDKRRSLHPLAAIKREPRPVPPPMGPDMCRILVDANPAGIIIPLATVNQCTYLLERHGFNKIANEHVVDLRKDSRALKLALTESDFHKIYDFLHNGKIVPDIVDVGLLSESKRVEHAEKLGMAFLTASKIQHEFLQETIQHKLCMAYPLPPLGIVIVATAILSIEVSNRVEKFLRDWIIDHIQYDFWGIARKAAQGLEKVMTDHGLHTLVFSKVGDRMEATRLASLNKQQIGALVKAGTVESHGHNQAATEGTNRNQLYHDDMQSEAFQVPNGHYTRQMLRPDVLAPEFNTDTEGSPSLAKVDQEPQFTTADYGKLPKEDGDGTMEQQDLVPLAL